MAKISKQALRVLKEARRAATFQTADFSDTFTEKLYDKDGVKIDRDALIKEATRLYRETWIIPYIDEVINWAENDQPLTLQSR